METPSQQQLQQQNQQQNQQYTEEDLEEQTNIEQTSFNPLDIQDFLHWSSLDTYGLYEYDEPMEMFDATSLYPYVMAERLYPTGKPSLMTLSKFNEIINNNIQVLFIVRCIINQFPDNTVSFPHIYYPYRNKDKSLQWSLPYITQDVTIPTPTYYDLINNKAIVTPIDWQTGASISNNDTVVGIMWPTKHYIFTAYVHKFLQTKLQEDAKPPEERNMAKREVSKLKLTSVSGKVIQKKHDIDSRFYTTAESLVSRANSENITQETLDATPLSAYTYPSGHAFVSMPTSKTPNIPAHIGVFIYAYARQYMWVSIFKHTKCIYTDTDSAIIPKSHSNFLRSKGLLGSRLGHFKSEGEFDTFYILAPKLYLCYNSNTKDMKARAKGVAPKSKYYSTKLDQDVTYEKNELDFFDQLYNDKSIKVKHFSIINNSKNGQLLHKSTDKIISWSPIIRYKE